MSKTIFDLDIGVDDCVALLLALASPELDLLAITCCFGNTLVSHVYENLQKTFNILEQELESLSQEERKRRWPGMVQTDRKIVVGRHGASQPIDGEPETAAYFHGPDGLSNISETHPEFNVHAQSVHPRLEVSDKSSAEVILETLANEDAGTVTLVALGPCESLATTEPSCDCERRAREPPTAWI